MIDSGCTDHLSPFIDDFIHLGDQKQTASVANGNKVSMYSPGTILIQQINGGFRPPTVSLEEVWYIPDSLHCLLSIPSLTHHGYCCEITNSESQIWDKRGHMVIQATALSSANNLHWFQSEIITPMAGIVASLADDHSYHIWHQHFGYTSWNALHHASTHFSGVPLLTLPADLALYKGCQIGKMPDHAFPTSGKQASYPLALVHTNLIGPMPIEPHSHARYTLTFVDDYTGYAFLSFLWAKLDCLSNFHNMVSWAEIFTGHTLVSVHSGQGGEFMEQEFQTFLTSNGVTH